MATHPQFPPLPRPAKQDQRGKEEVWFPLTLVASRKRETENTDETRADPCRASMNRMTQDLDLSIYADLHADTGRQGPAQACSYWNAGTSGNGSEHARADGIQALQDVNAHKVIFFGW